MQVSIESDLASSIPPVASRLPLILDRITA